MRSGLLVSDRHSLPRPWVPRSRSFLIASASLWQTFFATSMGAQIPVIPDSSSRIVVAKSCNWMLLVTTSALVPPPRVLKRLTTGRLTKSRICSAQHTKWKQQVTRSRGHPCGDIELAGYLANASGPVPLTLDLRITHDRFGRSSDPSINGHLHYPNDLDRTLNEAAADKIRSYRADYNNRPSNAISFIPAIASTSGRLHSDFVCLPCQVYKVIGKLTTFLQIQPPREFSLRNMTVASSTTTARCSPPSWNLRLGIFSLRLHHYGLFWISTVHLWRQDHTLTQTSRLLTSSLSLGVPVPRTTQCIWDVWSLSFSY